MSDLSMQLDPTTVGSPGYRDLIVSNGDLVLTSDASDSPVATDPVLQAVIQNLYTFLGEWYLNTSIGVPWLQQIFVKNGNQQTIDALIQDKILGTPGVRVLTQYQSTVFRAQRLIQIRFAIITNAGNTLNFSQPITLGTGA